jgi:signal peptidase II
MNSVSSKALLHKVLPFLLTIAIFVADQTSKIYIVKNWPVEEDGGRIISDVFDNGVLEIIHVRNKVIAFSLGSSLPHEWRTGLFIMAPLLVLILLLMYYFKSDDWSTAQRWSIAAILGGGAANLTDRIFHQGGIPGVVEFISVKLWGILGMERWPAFNIADASVVIAIFVWIATLFIPEKKKKPLKAHK